MATGKETPRQKMIGMMYLVLTALLALNVSKDILDAFIVVDKGLSITNTNFEERNDQLYASFDLAKSVDPVRIRASWEKAQEVKKHAAGLVSFIERLQKELIAKTDGIAQSVADTMQMENIAAKDNYDTPTNILIGESEDGSAGASRELKNKLNDYRTKLTSFILPDDRKNVSVDINTSDPAHSEENENWEMYNFYHRPLVASLTILTKLKSDVRNAESVIVDYLLKQNESEMLKFDTIAAKVIPQSNYVLLGQEYQADVFLAAFNKTKNPDIKIGDYDDESKKFNGATQDVPVEHGLGKYSVKADREGIRTYEGTIRMVSGKNKEMVFPFKSEYIVARPALTVSADNMNVVYPGLDNPISVSVPGIPNEKLTVSASNASLKNNGNGKYILTLKTGPKTVDVNVVATLDNGEKRSMGVMTFRVKRIPKPTLKFAQLTASGAMSKNAIANELGLQAFYENFDFAAKARVTSFTMTILAGGTAEDFEATGNMLTEKMKARLLRLRRNEKVIFDNVHAVGPDNQPVILQTISIKVQ